MIDKAFLTMQALARAAETAGLERERLLAGVDIRRCPGLDGNDNPTGELPPWGIAGDLGAIWWNPENVGVWLNNAVALCPVDRPEAVLFTLAETAFAVAAQRAAAPILVESVWSASDAGS